MAAVQDAAVRDSFSVHDVVAVGTVQTPLGPFGGVATSVGLAALTFPDDHSAPQARWVQRWMPRASVVSEHEIFPLLAEELTAYLEGSLKIFSIQLDLRGTPFQVDDWRALCEIPYGQVRSYGEIARAIGRPKAVRAVGAANHANPIPILVPCHRVIGSNGTLIGYGGGLGLKERLLQMEGVRLPLPSSHAGKDTLLRAVESSAP